MLAWMSRKLPRREGIKVVAKASTTLTVPASALRTSSSMASTGSTPSGGDGARRHQSHLDEEDEPADSAAPVVQRGGPRRLDELQLRVVAKTQHLLVINKREDHRLDGEFDATIEKALHRDYPEIDKFRWIHQLDFATSGVMCIGLDREYGPATGTATSVACRLFREKRVQKEYLAVVRGHMPFHPRDLPEPLARSRRIQTCTFSKVDAFIQDVEEFERLKQQMKGTPAQQKRPEYPRGVRQAPAFFQMERQALMKDIKDGRLQQDALDEDQQRLLGIKKWTDLTKEEQRRYAELAQLDKARFRQELSRFLDGEWLRVADERRYDSRDDGEGIGSEEPVAYVFDDPIAEPDRDAFRMRIGDREKPEDPIVGGKPSTTIAFVLGHARYQGEDVTKVLLRPLTGRRHQLRLHLSHNGFPIIGDATYASPDETAPRMMLHAWRLWLMARPEEHLKYGDLHFTTPDPFEDIVPSQRELTTMSAHKTTGS
ncbi:hypothetical protein ATCC90586_005335 [Pythium insidiosum]|nr:hypothetical protein ATCC90586_005335 [Pythium insidiosum]